MERVIDYLAEEETAEQRKEATRARKAGKHDRIQKMLKNLMTAEPAPMVDLLAVLGN